MGAPAVCPPSLWESGDLTWSITDPDRYTGKLANILNVTTRQVQGLWQASVSFDTLLGSNNPYVFTYTSHGDETEYGNTIYPPNDNLTDLQNPPWSFCTLRIPASLEGDADGNDFTYHDEFNGLVTSGNCENMNLRGTTEALSVDVTVRRLLGMDLTVNHLEVTQGLQDGANSIPLVQGRRTVVHAFIGLGDSQEAIPGVTATLTGYSDAAELGTVPPFNPGEQITAPVSPDWMKINDTLNFELPLAWTL